MSGREPIERKAEALRALAEVVARLRAPDGCPWDRAQTVESLGPFLLEEVHETLEAIARGSAGALREELGDVLMNVLLLADAAEAEGRTTLAEVADAISAKLVRRHPHVFGERAAAGVAEVWTAWERIKAEEKRARGEDASAISGVPPSLPALLRALRTVEKAQRAGFRWSDLEGPTAKVDEEWAELRSAVASGESARVDEELGDLLLAVVVLASHLSADPEASLRRATERFARRFRSIEGDLGARLREAPLEELLAAWSRAKNLVDGPGPPG
jgi:MazG family protein